MNLRSLFIALALVTLPAAFMAPAFADVAPVYTKRNSDLALSGYDAVAYFTLGEPTEGDAAYVTDYQGAVFQFASQDNLDLFLADPDKYAPQYGGYCAWAAAKGKSAAGNPRHWAIVDGRLYLNYSRGIQKKWDASRTEFIRDADEKWPDILGVQNSSVPPTPRPASGGS